MTLECTFCAKIDYPVAPVWMQCGHEPPVPSPRTRYEMPTTGHESALIDRLDRILNVLEGGVTNQSNGVGTGFKSLSAIMPKRPPSDTVCACGKSKKPQFPECYSCSAS